jgi:hypothetical protein
VDKNKNVVGILIYEGIIEKDINNLSKSDRKYTLQNNHVSKSVSKMD